jgi:hypothetical protein
MRSTPTFVIVCVALVVPALASCADSDNPPRNPPPEPDRPLTSLTASESERLCLEYAEANTRNSCVQTAVTYAVEMATSDEDYRMHCETRIEPCLLVASLPDPRDACSNPPDYNESCESTVADLGECVADTTALTPDCSADLTEAQAFMPGIPDTSACNRLQNCVNGD